MEIFVFLITILFAVTFFLYYRVRRDTVILKALMTTLNNVILDAFIKLCDIPLEDRKGKTQQLCHMTYNSLPSLVIVQVEDLNVIVPLRSLLGEAVFMDACARFYLGESTARKELMRELELSYRHWKILNHIEIEKGINLWTL